MSQPSRPAPLTTTTLEPRPRPVLRSQPPPRAIERRLNLQLESTSRPPTSSPSSPLIAMSSTADFASTFSMASTSGQLPQPRSPRPRSHPLPPRLLLSTRGRTQMLHREDLPSEMSTTRAAPQHRPGRRPRSYPLPPPLPLSPVSPLSPSRVFTPSGANGNKARPVNGLRTPPCSVPASYTHGQPLPVSSPSPPLTAKRSHRPRLETPVRRSKRRSVSFPPAPSPPPSYASQAFHLLPEVSLSPMAIISAFSASALLVAWTVLVLDDSSHFSPLRGGEELVGGMGVTAVTGLSEALQAVGMVVEGGWLASLGRSSWGWEGRGKRMERGKVLDSKRKKCRRKIRVGKKEEGDRVYVEKGKKKMGGGIALRRSKGKERKQEDG
ncbi:hypothetical protein IWX49DRAFT_553889 [Phyllosticta citricarpa]|uniref:Uncharacterized protein n=2 Tax=Phyllosticta TaxID=121621 RepID=A0ABR1MEJ5_9PEZI